MEQGCLPGDLDAVSGTRATATNVTGGDHFDPQGTVAVAVRGGGGIAKCIQAALLGTRRCGGESGDPNITHEPASSCFTLMMTKDRGGKA